MQCRGYRGNEESFTADIWFSTYKEGLRNKLAAIVVEVPNESGFAQPSGSEQAAPAALNFREIQVLRLLVRGLSNKEIAGNMEISESAVKNTLRLLFTKTAVRTRSQLVRVALEDYRDDLTVGKPSATESLSGRSPSFPRREASAENGNHPLRSATAI
jgi:DNA-binding CsgD family transcriptional regulator